MTKSKRNRISKSPDSLRYVAGLNGFTINGLARSIGRTREACRIAWKHPKRYPLTRRLLESALQRRSL